MVELLPSLIWSFFFLHIHLCPYEMSFDHSLTLFIDSVETSGTRPESFHCPYQFQLLLRLYLNWFYVA